MFAAHLRLAAVAFVAVGFALCAKANGTDRVIHSDGVEIHYLGHTAMPQYKAHYPREIWGQLYSALAIRSRSGAMHRLKADSEYGLFVAAAEPTISPGGKYVVVEQLVAGYAEDGQQRWWHEVDYCAFIETDTARLVTRETGGYCGGEFSDPNTWVSIDGHELNLAALSQ